AGGVLPGRARALAFRPGGIRGGWKWRRSPSRSVGRVSLMKATTAIILIVISLAAVGAITYGSYRERERSNDLEDRIVALEHASTESGSDIERLTADKVKL